MTVVTTTKPYGLGKEQGITDLWWPFGPSVGRYTIKAAAEQTGGRMIQLVIRESRGAGTPLHIHRDADESFYVVEGEIAVFVGDERFEAKAGDYVFAPMGVAHAFSVVGPCPAPGELCRCRHRGPARLRCARLLQRGRNASRGR